MTGEPYVVLNTERLHFVLLYLTYWLCWHSGVYMQSM